MALFPTKKPRGFRYQYRYTKKHDMNFHGSLRKKRCTNAGVLVILLVLLLVLWFYLN